jgi:hypothetical protein
MIKVRDEEVFGLYKKGINGLYKKALVFAVYKGGITKPYTLVSIIDTRFFMNWKKTASNFI